MLENVLGQSRLSKGKMLIVSECPKAPQKGTQREVNILTFIEGLIRKGIFEYCLVSLNSSQVDQDNVLALFISSVYIELVNTVTPGGVFVDIILAWFLVLENQPKRLIKYPFFIKVNFLDLGKNLIDGEDSPIRDDRSLFRLLSQ